VAIAEKELVGLSHRFSVTLDEGKIDLGTYTKVDGIKLAFDFCEYRAGDGEERWYYPGFAEFPNIKLSRAVSKETSKVREWLVATREKVEFHSGTINLHDASGEIVTSWTLRHIMPVTWAVTPFDANQSKVAIETLELAHMGFLDG